MATTAAENQHPLVPGVTALTAAATTAATTGTAETMAIRTSGLEPVAAHPAAEATGEGETAVATALT
jgi:hypothetical protein